MRSLLLIFTVCTLSYMTKAQSISPSILEFKIDSLVSQTIKSNQPGGVVGVISNHRVIFKKAYGMMNLDYNLPNTETTAFNLASVSKQFTSFAILLLERDGKLKLDDEIHQYLPWVPDYGHKITIRNLLHHTSGIAPSDNLRLFAGISLESPWATEDEIELLTRYPKLNFIPNDEHLYSNAGYFLLGQIVEKASQQTFSEYMKTRIFDPLGMSNSAIYDRQGKVIANKASGYKKTGEEYIRMNPEADSFFGETNLYTSLNDMLLWCTNLMEPKVGNQEMIDRIFNPSDTLNRGDTISYTYGFNIWKYKGIKIADHGGYTMGYKTQVMVFPDQEFAVFVLFNNESFDTWNLATKIVDWSLAKQLAPDKPKEHRTIALDNGVLTKYEGSFQMPDGSELTFKNENDTLKIIIPDAPKFIMNAESENKFYLKEADAQCTFVKGSDNLVNELTWHQNNQDFKGIRVANKKVLKDGELEEYAGTYFSEPLNVGYHISYENNRLILNLPKTFKTYLSYDVKMPLNFLNGDKFTSQGVGVVEFTRANDQKINGFKFVDVGRVRNIEFKKRL